MKTSKKLIFTIIGVSLCVMNLPLFAAEGAEGEVSDEYVQPMTPWGEPDLRGTPMR